MSVDLVVSGKAGTATRTTPRDRVRMFGTVVDEWVMQPAPTGMAVRPVHMAVVDADYVRPGMVLVVSSLDPVMRDQCDWLALPVTLATHVHAADLMPADDHDHARIVTRQLARAAVDGHLPITPGQPDYARTWAVAVRTLCALTSGNAEAATGPVAVRTG